METGPALFVRPVWTRSPPGSSLTLTPSAEGTQQVTGPWKLDYPSCRLGRMGRLPNENGWSGALGTAECTKPSAALQTAFLKQHPPPGLGSKFLFLRSWKGGLRSGQEGGSQTIVPRSSSSPDGLRGNLCSQVPGLAKPESAKGKWSHHKEMGTRERQAGASPHQRPSVAMRAGLGAGGIRLAPRCRMTGSGPGLDRTPPPPCPSEREL